MIKIKILELDKHRNETTFRPYLMARRELYDIGIEFTTGDSYDYAWVGQASIADKKLPLEESVDMGYEFCRKITGDYLIFDGQDSHSLIGVGELVQRLRLDSSNAGYCFKMLLKNTLLTNKNWYKDESVNGRWYWRPGSYSIPNIDHIWDVMHLSGTNWLSTVSKNGAIGHVEFINPKSVQKYHDVCGLFGYPLKEGIEHGVEHYREYNRHRKPCVDELQWVKDNTQVDVQLLENGIKLPAEDYHRIMYTSRIVVAPFGFGEIAPRDIQAAAYGSVLIKPDMSHIQTEPNPYIPGVTYVPCAHDYSDLDEVIDTVLSDYDRYQEEICIGMRDHFQRLYSNGNLAMYMYNLFTNRLLS